jgi:hypothetical protein
MEVTRIWIVILLALLAGGSLLMLIHPLLVWGAVGIGGLWTVMVATHKSLGTNEDDSTLHRR